MICLAIMGVASGALAGVMISSAQQREADWEWLLARDAARMVVEQMRNTDFEDVYRLYNENDADDPAGPGTAPGARFEVEGLTPLEASPDGLCGSVRFPTVSVPSLIPGGEPAIELRENAAEFDLGMPRDLNGDSIVDERDHTDDYFLLPVRVRIEWQGRFGPRQFQCYTQLSDVNRL